MIKLAPHPNAGREITLPTFGLIELERVLAADDLFAVVGDKFPVSPGHTLIVPRRALTCFLELTDAEHVSLMHWVAWTQTTLMASLKPTPDAFNLGVNDGQAAGQTMPQFHFHVVPRYMGDVGDPRGGIRWVIPTRAKYW
jgi:diadenosine tetraphosphate (Ap4A) HIT family hydrolase